MCATFVDAAGQKWQVILGASCLTNGEIVFNPDDLFRRITATLATDENIIFDRTKLNDEDFEVMMERIHVNVPSNRLHKILLIHRKDRSKSGFLGTKE